jgi:hypothetical protein
MGPPCARVRRTTQKKPNPSAQAEAKKGDKELQEGQLLYRSICFLHLELQLAGRRLRHRKLSCGHRSKDWFGGQGLRIEKNQMSAPFGFGFALFPAQQTVGKG